MLKWIIRHRLAAFERQHAYDMSYARVILAALYFVRNPNKLRHLA